MAQPATHHESLSPQHRDVDDATKTLMTNAIILQTTEYVSNNTASRSEGLRSFLTRHLAAEGPPFSVFPIAPGGRFKNLERHLLIWGSMCGACCSPPADISSRAVKTIAQATAQEGFGYSVNEVTKRESERVVRGVMRAVGSNPAKLSEEPVKKVLLEVIEVVFGQPVPRPGTDTSNPSSSAQQPNMGSTDRNTHAGVSQVESDAEVPSQGTGPGGQGTRQQFEARFAIEGQKQMGNGSEIGFEEVGSMMELLARSSKKKKALFPTVTLVAPPPSHPTTTILQPSATANPPPENSEETKVFSPLDYSTNIGNAAVVHQIYLDAKNTGVPRTTEEELARRHRACQMVLKEIRDVVQQARWHRNERGYKEGPGPCVLEGIESVPTDDKRDWLLGKLAILKGRQRECRITIWDNNEAYDHLTVLVHALYVCKLAGPQGITF